jgi:hypothetical protein
MCCLGKPLAALDVRGPRDDPGAACRNVCTRTAVRNSVQVGTRPPIQGAANPQGGRVVHPMTFADALCDNPPLIERIGRSRR